MPDDAKDLLVDNKTKCWIFNANSTISNSSYKVEDI